ncbi:MAG: response regulator transcription factor [Oligoflexia bacterium]|nr:response regulator transcription factor [Oligoflexia bacterium]
MNNITSKIAILEDDLRVSNFIANGLKAEFCVVETFNLINDFLEILPDQSFDILIMDRMIGKLDSVKYITKIREFDPNIKIIILSALSGSLNRISGLEMGADDYLEKPFQFQELNLRIKKLFLKNNSSDKIINYKDITLDIECQRMQRNGKIIYLSPYEFKLISIFLKNPKKIYSRTELLDLVWGYNCGTSSNVVDVAIGKLKKKINFTDSENLIISRRGCGYVFSEEL